MFFLCMEPKILVIWHHHNHTIVYWCLILVVYSCLSLLRQVAPLVNPSLAGAYETFHADGLLGGKHCCRWKKQAAKGAVDRFWLLQRKDLFLGFMQKNNPTTMVDWLGCSCMEISCCTRVSTRCNLWFSAMCLFFQNSCILNVKHACVAIESVKVQEVGGCFHGLSGFFLLPFFDQHHRR